MRQPRLIEIVIGTSGLSNKQVCSNPMPFTSILRKDESGDERKDICKCRSLILMLNYLAHVNMPHVIILVHQCAHVYADQKISHEKAVKRAMKRLIGTKCTGEEAIIDLSKGLIFL